MSNVRSGGEHREKHNRFASPIDADMPGLRRSAKEAMKGEPVFLDLEQAEVLVEQFRKTAEIRNWTLVGVAVMSNHFHAIVETGDAENPENVMRDLKSYGSKTLNKRYGKPTSGTWWTAGGSNRPKKADAIPVLVRYLKNQERILAIWIDPRYDSEPGV